jgi:FlaA1/EpsC-like NDP-sugar epimerase
MFRFISKELRLPFFFKKFQNLGYLPRWIIFSIDLCIVAMATLVTYVIVDNLSVSYNGMLQRPLMTLLVVSIYAMFFIIIRTYAGIIRHSTFIDGIKLLVASTCAYIALLVMHYFFYFINDIKIFIPTALFITYIVSFLLLFLFRILVKNVFETYMHYGESRNLIRAVIYGTNSNAISIANALKAEKPTRFKLVAFIDKYNVAKASKSILDIPIVSQIKSLPLQLGVLKAEALIIAENSLSKDETVAIVEECIENGFKVYTVPLITDWEDKKQLATQIKNFAIEDLLGRKPIVLDTNKISNQINYKTVLVTGGAGSIGSEIVRQLLYFKPSKIIILDQAETPINSLKIEIQNLDCFEEIEVITIVADIRDKFSLDKIFSNYKYYWNKKSSRFIV